MLTLVIVATGLLVAAGADAGESDGSSAWWRSPAPLVAASEAASPGEALGSGGSRLAMSRVPEIGGPGGGEVRFDWGEAGSWNQADADDLEDDGRPSRGRTLIYSALLPGLGQHLWGRKGAAATFMVVEAASWTSLVVFQVQGSSRKDRYIQYAERFAGVVDASGQGNDYYRALARYDRSDPGPGSYNEIEVRLLAKRELYPDDPAAQQRYIAENSITGDLAWNWESEARREAYADIRNSSESAYHNAKFAVAGLIGGRILSVMHALWMTGGVGEGEGEDSSEGAASFARAFAPFVEPDFARGENRVGLRRSF